MYYFSSHSTCPSLGTGCSFSWLLCLFDILHQCELCISILTTSLSNSKDHTGKNVTWGVLRAPLTIDSPPFIDSFSKQVKSDFCLFYLFSKYLLSDTSCEALSLRLGTQSWFRKPDLGMDMLWGKYGCG